MPSVHPECYFPAEQRGRWLLFDAGGRHDEVVVDPGHVTFSQLGSSFICKSKHWRKDQYKTLSVYANGWSVSVTEAFVLSPLSEDLARITKSVRIRVTVSRVKQKCFQ